MQQLKDDSLEITGQMIQEKALQYAQHFELKDFNATDRWLAAFKSRIQFNVNRDENDEYKKISNWLELILYPALKNISPDDVFNMTEFGLFYRATPQQKLISSFDRCSEGRLSKERLTVLVGANMSGNCYCTIYSAHNYIKYFNKRFREAPDDDRRQVQTTKWIREGEVVSSKISLQRSSMDD